MTYLRYLVLLFCLPVLVASAADPDEVRARAEAAFAKDDFQGALDAYADLDDDQRKDPFVLYNMACAHAMLGEVDDGAERLLDALTWGFVDLFHMSRDPQLEPLHDDERYRTIVRGWNRILDARAEADRRILKAQFDKGYVHEVDEALRLNYASAFDHPTHIDARAQIDGVAEWVSRHQIFAPLEEQDDSRDDPWVKVVLPTRSDFIRLVPAVHVGGFYDRDSKRLVSQDIGPSLRHEFFHVLHWRHMDRIGQRHPLWIQEGMAALFEDVEGVPGDWTFTPSWRTNIVKRIERTGRLHPWKSFFAMPDKRYMDLRPSANYAYSRAIFLFLEHRGLLVPWYRAYVGGFDEDPTGLSAMEQTFELPAREIQREFRQWVRDLPAVGEVGRPGAAGIGLKLGAGTGDGPVIAQIVAGTGRGGAPGSSERLRQRDVITAIDGQTVRTLDDIYRVLGEYDVGDEVVVTVRRIRKTMEIPVRLVEGDDESFP